MTTPRFQMAAGSHVGAALVQQVLEEAGWRATGGVDWRLHWSLPRPADAVFRHLATGRWVNHYWDVGALNAKHRLADVLTLARATLARLGLETLADVAPPSYVLPRDYEAWRAEAAWAPDRVWIAKPHASSRGRGVAIVTSPAAVSRDHAIVIQRYVDRPHLLDGHKYTLRCYVAITSLDPLVAHLFDDGFAKLTSRPFSLAPDHRADRFRHLTNPEVLAADADVPVSSRNMTHAAYRARLRREGVDDALVWARLRQVLAATVASARDVMLAPMTRDEVPDRGMFELLGVDVTLDADLRPWVLECNMTPSLRVEADASTAANRDERQVKTRVVTDTLRLAGVFDGPSPAPIADEAEALRRLEAQRARLGGFTPLVPSPDSLALLPLLEGGRFDGAAHGWACRDGHPPLVAHHAVAMPVDDGLAVFSETDGVVDALNPPAAWTWLALADGLTVAAAAGELAAATPEADAAVVAGDVWRLAATWVQRGLLRAADTPVAGAPARPGALPPRGPTVGWGPERTYAWGEVRAVVRYPSREVEDLLHPLLALHESPGGGDVDGAFTVLWHDGAIVTPDGRTVPAGTRHDMAVALHRELRVLRALRRRAVLETTVHMASVTEGTVVVLAGDAWPAAWVASLGEHGWSVDLDVPVYVSGDPVGVERRERPGAPLHVAAIAGWRPGEGDVAPLGTLDAYAALTARGRAQALLVTAETMPGVLEWLEGLARFEVRASTAPALDRAIRSALAPPAGARRSAPPETP